MATYPTDGEIDSAFPDNETGEIGADDMRAFQKEMTAAGKDYAAMTANVPTAFPPAPHTHTVSQITDYVKPSVLPHSAATTYAKDDFCSLSGNIYFALVANGPGAFDVANWKAVGAATGTGVTFTYDYSTTTAGQIPDGRFGFTDALGNPTNTIRVSINNAFGLDLSAFWSNVRAGDYIFMVENTGGAESWLGSATGPAVLVAGAPDYYTIPVSFITLDGESENGRELKVSIVTNPDSKLPSGGTTGQVLTKLSDDDYDVAWVTPT